jgi:hypothetical protein
MKKFLIGLLTLIVLLTVTVSTYAFTISVPDPNDDAVGVQFETTGMKISDIYVDPLTITISTVYPEAGVTVGDWATLPADIFITETYLGDDYLWAIPLIDHDDFRAGGFYAVESFYISNDFEPDTGGPYVYNENAPVWIETQGVNYGNGNWSDGDNVYDFISTPSVTWDGTAGTVVVALGGVYMDSKTTALDFYWGTATCGNDEVGNAPVPEPATILLFGLSLLGFAGVSRKKQK